MEAPHVPKSAGTTAEERESFGKLLDCGFKDAVELGGRKYKDMLQYVAQMQQKKGAFADDDDLSNVFILYICQHHRIGRL